MAAKLTPMMEQYQRIRRGLPPKTLLLFRLGDFYEMFFDDAKLAAGILNVALTKRNGVPMCGVPYHAAESYIAKLIAAGLKAAVCDQIGEPKAGKIVERQITQIISPGTVGDINLLDSARPNFLAAIAAQGSRRGLAWLDLSTGDFRLAQVEGDDALDDELARISPAEILIPDDCTELAQRFGKATTYDSYTFLPAQAEHFLKEHFGVASLDGFGCDGLDLPVGAAGAALHYVASQLRRDVSHIRSLRVCSHSQFVGLGRATQDNLELVESRTGGKSATLLAALDRTATPMGARKLRDWILHPLRDASAIRARQQVVADLLESPALLDSLRSQLRNIRDIERTVGRLSQGSGTPRDMLALRVSLEHLPEVKALISSLAALPETALGSIARETAPPSSMANWIIEHLHELPDVARRLREAIVDDPPATLKEGGVFRPGYHPELDEMRHWSGEGKDWLAQMQAREIERTGIKSLKIKYNAVFGYFIELTKANLAHVPPDYIRKQTTANAERFVTPELKEMEGKILRADEAARALELQLFSELRSYVIAHLGQLQQTADALATLDALTSFAETARLFDYCRPQLVEEPVLVIRDGRHPVLDQNPAGGKFVPNDIEMDPASSRLLLITGPNMAGKSTFIRQVALITLMAHAGSFVPAREATIGLVDRIFTRVGASDDLSRGQSTFMVEMNETANIINNATSSSLVILDEIGRGTSTFDGLSIAWSVAEHLHDTVQARTLFATHYHELTDLARTRSGVRNLNVAVREWNDQIIFLHKIMPGAADKSYGIQVAKLAGLPGGLITRAKEILANLERHELNADGQPALATAGETAAHVSGSTLPHLTQSVCTRRTRANRTAQQEGSGTAPASLQLSFL